MTNRNEILAESNLSPILSKTEANKKKVAYLLNSLCEDELRALSPQWARCHGAISLQHIPMTTNRRGPK